MTKEKWFGPTPRHCEFCLEPLKKIFFDAKLNMGGWAILCPECHKMYASGRLGTGKGQKYNLKTKEKMEG